MIIKKGDLFWSPFFLSFFYNNEDRYQILNPIKNKIPNQLTDFKSKEGLCSTGICFPVTNSKFEIAKNGALKNDRTVAI